MRNPGGPGEGTRERAGHERRPRPEEAPAWGVGGTHRRWANSRVPGGGSQDPPPGTRMSASRGWDIAASGRSAIRGRNAGRELRRGRRQRRPRWPGTVLPSGPERGPEREHDGKAPLSLTRPEPFRARASLLQLGNQTRRPVISLLGFPGSWKPGARSPAQRDSPVSKDTSKSAPDGGQPADGLVCVRGGAQRARESETRPGPGSCGPVRWESIAGELL